MYKETIIAVISGIWPSLLILITILFSIRFFSFISNKKEFVFYREMLYLIFVVYLMCFFYVLTFADVDWSTANIIPFKEIFRFEVGSRSFIKNVLGNMILFMPYGFYLAYFTKIRKVRYIFAFSVFISIAVEIIQYRIGRVFDIDDIILNVIGGILGYFVYQVMDFLLNQTVLKKKKGLICNLVVAALIVAFAVYIGVWLWTILKFLTKQKKVLKKLMN